MKPILTSLALAGLGLAGSLPRQSNPEDVRDLPITRKGSKLYLGDEEWKAVGANIYWLGMDENVVPPPGEDYFEPENISYPTKGRIVEMMNVMKAMGGTMIRAHTLGSSTGTPLSVMPEPYIINDKAFEAIDFAVYQARKAGLRLMVPLVDNYDYYHGGKYDFMRWRGYDVSPDTSGLDPILMAFYESPPVVTLFKAYVERLLTHVNPLTGLSYADDPTIFAVESGNELDGYRWSDMRVPTTWLRDIARHVKGLAPHKLFVDGTYGVNSSHFEVDEVDIFSDHFYPASVDRLQMDLDKVKESGRAFFAGEYDWVGQQGQDELKEWYGVLEESDVAAGDTFWSLFGRNVPNCDVSVPCL
jgi:mannan endo-1,4-beta-mannosidase